MPRSFTDPKLVVASHNDGKVREIRSLLSPFGVETVSAAELGLSVQDIEISIFESDAHNWGFRGMHGDEVQLNYKINV